MEREGLHCPHPDKFDKLDDDAVSELLWKVIGYYARRNTFPSPTDHLSDRELYRRLYEVAEEEPTRDWAAVLEPHEITQVGAWVNGIDLFELNSDEDVQLYARYFLKDDDKERTYWSKSGEKTIELPSYEGAPYDRDRFMPRPLDEQLRARGEEPRPDQIFDQGETDPKPRELYDDEGGDRRPIRDDDIPF